MNIKHYTVPPEAFPRYRYARDNVTPLLRRSRIVMKKCALEDPFPIPDLKEVHIYIISENGTNLINQEELTKKPCKAIICEAFDNMNHEEFKEKTKEQLFVCVSSCEQADKQGTKMWEYFGQAVVLFSKETDTQQSPQSPQSPDVRSVDNAIVCVKPRSCFAFETDIVLERMVFKYLYPRVRVLHSFLQMEPLPLVTASINTKIETALSSKMKMRSRRSSERNENDDAHLFKTWHEVRLEVIKTLVNEAYSKDDVEIKEQILQPLRTSVSAADVQPLTICEHILPHLADGPATGSTRKQVPDSLLAKVKDMNIAAGLKSKADAVALNFINNLTGVCDNKEQIEELYDDCMGMYMRSKVLEFEKPKHMKKKPHRLEDSLANELLKVNGVTGCGYRSSVLDIYLNDSMTVQDRKKSESELKNIIARNNVERYQLRYEQKLRKLYSVGSKVSGEHGRSASLGGFAKRGPNKRLSILLARHFTENCSKISVQSNSEITHIAEVLQPVSRSETFSTDISAADVLESVVNRCSTQFRDQYGVASDSSLQQFEENDIETLQGLPVHIWGAASSPGLGKIIIPDYAVEHDEGMDPLRFVKIEDRHPDESYAFSPFAKEGDSGAIVCADDSSGEYVRVVSMVIGSSIVEGDKQSSPKKTQYLTFRLKDGLYELENEHGEEFNIC